MGIREVEVAGNTVTIHEADDVYDPVTGRALTGSWVWDSAFILSEWMVHHGRLDFDLHGRTVVELGAGTGLPGLTAALLGANHVVLTDVAQLLPGLQKNVEANSLGDRVEVRELLWGLDDLRTSGVGELEDVDLVLMSDVFFDASEMRALAKTLKRLCGRETRVWSASEVREWIEESLEELRREGFRVVELPSQQLVLSSSAAAMATEESPSFAIFVLVPPSCDSGPETDTTEVDT
ncbi:protein N-lysine methyltransferase METTL21A-like [Macadamia integrifolia]|uniref:protein N-lysine methyltransferase METTL21A-like n=1 Tax=Macadamia integrifolia TaxID=60698 RepID=UPI001C4EBA2B|nr:protein N-lysine methyltransferase METTL21A-like [Macadamia integrifolia]